MKKSFHKGFTLIELLVVVAIIALLAATILASLGSARTKARDARVVSELSSLRAQMELFSNSNGFTYGSSTNAYCGSSPWNISSAQPTNGPQTLIQGISNDLNGSPSSFSNMACNTSGTAWAVSALLPGGSYWCVDSNGSSKSGTAANLANGVYSCP